MGEPATAAAAASATSSGLTTGLLSSSSCSSSSGAPVSSTTTTPSSATAAASATSYSLRAKQQLKLAQLAETSPTGKASSSLDSSSSNNASASSPANSNNSSSQEARSNNNQNNGSEYEKENDSGIEKDDSLNTLLVRVAINDQNLQASFLSRLFRSQEREREKSKKKHLYYYIESDAFQFGRYGVGGQTTSVDHSRQRGQRWPQLRILSAAVSRPRRQISRRLPQASRILAQRTSRQFRSNLEENK